MTNISLEFPPGFDDYEWEVEAKGWFPGVVAVIEGRRYTLTVYDPARLAEDVGDAVRGGGVFLERNLVVVASVTRKNNVSALEEVAQTGRVGDHRPHEGGLYGA
jgi:hypothetical protein